MGDSYYYSDDGSGFAALAILLFLIPFLLIASLAGYLISSFLFMRIFDKAGVQGKWRAWVPIYNTLVASKLGDLSPWVFLGAGLVSGVLANIPVIGPVLGLIVVAAAVMAAWRIGLKFGKDWPWLLLWLIPGIGPLIWLAIIAFGSDRWNPAIAPAPWSRTFLADKTFWNGIPVQPSQQVADGASGGGYGAPGSAGPGYAGPGYGAPPAPGTTPPPPPSGTTPPPPAPPAGPQV